MKKMDKELTTIREFVEFANEILKSKTSDNMYRMISKPATLTPNQIKDIKAIFSTYFSNVQEWKDFKGKIAYKVGDIDMARLEKACAKKDEDRETFDAFLSTLRAIYFDVRKNINEFITKLGLEEGSDEANFMSTVFNEIGGELLDTIKSGGDTKDVATLLPRVFDMLKNGSLMRCFERLKDGSIKVSKILRAITRLVEDWENETNAAITTSTTTDTVESTLAIEE